MSSDVEGTTNDDPCQRVLDKSWPLPSECIEGVGDATSGTFVDSSVWDFERWQTECRNQDISKCYFRTWTSEGFDVFHDVYFEVGRNKVEKSAHRLMLLLSCENEMFRNSLNQSFKDKFIIRLPHLDPTAFMSVLTYIYTGYMKIEDVPHALGILAVAKSFGVPELQSTCYTFLPSNISYNDAVDVLSNAIESNDERLKQISVSFITRNIEEFLSSDGFLALSDKKLFTFLQNDDWCVDNELLVFESVIRWATHKINSKCQPINKNPSGTDLREVLGQAFYQIRFASLNDATMVILKNASYQGLFNPDEVLALCTFIATKSNSESRVNGRDQALQPVPSLANFNLNPRVNKENAELPTSTTQDDILESDNNPTVASDEDKLLDTFTSITVSTNESAAVIKKSPTHDRNPLIKTSTGAVAECDSSLNPPPPKKRKIVKKSGKKMKIETSSSVTPQSSMVIHSPPLSPPEQNDRVSKDVNLNDLVNSLRSNEDSIHIEEIKKVVKWSYPQNRVYLPNLKKFDLTIVPNNYRHFECGSALKTFVKGKWSNLPEILFFDTRVQNNLEGSEETNVGGNILTDLLTLKVNITITCSNTVFLKINHDEGIILLNLIKDTQDILKGARDFPLRKLLLSECELYSLDDVNTELLEVVVMRRVKGLKNHANFLKKCKNLRVVSWNDLGSEEINITETLFGKKNLRKLSLAKCKLTVSGTLDDNQNYLNELYLDNCDVKSDVIATLPTLFPYVKRLQLYGKQADAKFLHSILQMESLQWLFIWEFVYCRVKRSKKHKWSELTPESKQIQQLLISIFDDADFAKKDKITFTLKKKEDFTQESPSTSISALEENKRAKNPFDASSWQGMQFKSKEKFDIISKLDFENFSYDEFFSTYENFIFFESTEKDMKKEKKKKQNSCFNDDNQTIASSVIEILEPVSNSSTEEAVDIVGIC